MKKLLLLTLSLTSMLAMNSCKSKDEPTPINPAPCQFNCDTSMLEVIWQMPLNAADTGAYGSFTPIVYNDDVLFSLKYLTTTNSEYLHMRDGKTGELKWEWFNYFIEGQTSGELSSLVIDHRFVFTTWHDTYCVDLNNGQDIWRHDLVEGCGDPLITRVGDYIYHLRTNCGVAAPTNSVVKSKFDDGIQWDTVFTAYQRDGYSPYLAPPSYWVSPEGDTILLILSRTLNLSLGFPESNQVDVYTYNLTQDSLVYHLKHIDEGDSGYANYRPPTVWNDRMFIQGGFKLYCFDIRTGEKLWTKTLETHNVLTGLLMVDDKIILKTDDESIYSINPETGGTIWKNVECGSNCSEMKEYDGIIYYGCLGDGYLYAINAETGVRIWKEKSPNDIKGYNEAGFYVGVAINPALGCLYTHDNHFAMCIKLAKK